MRGWIGTALMCATAPVSALAAGETEDQARSSVTFLRKVRTDHAPFSIPA